VVSPPTERSRVPLPSGGSITPEFSRALEVVELAHTDAAFYISLRLRGSSFTRPENRNPQLERPVLPEVLALADGFPIPLEVTRSAVIPGSAEASWLAVALAGLPDGDLDLTVRARGDAITFPLRKGRGSIRWLATAERRGYRKDPAALINPATGLALAAETVEGPAHDVRDLIEGAAP